MFQTATSEENKTPQSDAKIIFVVLGNLNYFVKRTYGKRNIKAMVIL
jgi:hypothetical protein